MIGFNQTMVDGLVVREPSAGCIAQLARMQDSSVEAMTFIASDCTYDSAGAKVWPTSLEASAAQFTLVQRCAMAALHMAGVDLDEETVRKNSEAGGHASR